MAEKSFGVKDLNIVGASGDPTIESNGDLNLKAVSYTHLTLPTKA